MDIQQILEQDSDLFFNLKNLTPKQIYNLDIYFKKYTTEINSAQFIIHIIYLLKDYKYLFVNDRKDIFHFTTNIINNELNKYVD
jgi:hypothetical protein